MFFNHKVYSFYSSQKNYNHQLPPAAMEPSMENCLAQVLQKDVGRRLQVGQEIIDYISDREKSHDLEQDQTLLDKMVDGIATSWVNSSNFKVRIDF